MEQIKFGTDGWRAVIAKEYTFDNVNRVTQAVSKWIQKSGITKNGVVIGYDARFLGREFAEHAAEVFAAMEIPVRISDRIVSTPAVSWAAKHYDALGIVITASHNPPEYNGFKIKAPFGGSATPDHISGIEQELPNIVDVTDVQPYKNGVKKGLIRELDLGSGYLNFISENLDMDSIRKSQIKIAHNPMYGSGMGYLRELLGDQVVECNHHRDPTFGGIAPEPVEHNLKEFPDFVLSNNCDIGIANDGDADRIAMVDEKGKFVDSHRMLSLLTKYLHLDKKMVGTVVKTFSTSSMVNKQAESYGLPLEETPIGFKYIADLMIQGNVLAGGEESGGLAVKGHIPERDGIYIGLLIAEMMVKKGKMLSELVQELFDEYGPHEYYRSDVLTQENKKIAMIQFCKDKKLTMIAGKKVTGWDFKDGIKHLMEDGTWLLVRQSGTEPVLRIYAEATKKKDAIALVEDAKSWVDRPEILQQ